MKISLYSPLSIHEIGQRPNQEDSIAQWDNRLFVLCDGMGGHEKGEVASQTICKSIGDWYNTRAIHPFGKPQVEDALAYAYAQLDEKDGGEFKKMGTTLTLLYIGSEGVIAAHIGDSRIYHIRPGVGVLYQSRDHSLAFDLFQAGEITYEEIATFPRKNIVTRAMTPGKDNRMRPDIIHITDVQPGDYFYLCSDGMLEQMGNDELLTLFASDITDEEKQKQLINATSANQDNHSAWLIHVKDVVKEEGDEELENEEPTARCNVINIIPKVIEVHEDDDVVIVSQPYNQHKKKNKWVIVSVLILTVIVALATACMFFFCNDDKPKPRQRPKPMMQTPISPRFNNDTTKKDSNRLRQHEPARNQQPYNASRRNDSTRYISH